MFCNMAIIVLYYAVSTYSYNFRQCLCIYRDQKNIERFALAIQCLTCICVSHLKNLRFTLKPPTLESENCSNSTSDPASCSNNSAGFENSENLNLWLNKVSKCGIYNSKFACHICKSKQTWAQTFFAIF